jgi:hypothetical protein
MDELDQDIYCGDDDGGERPDFDGFEPSLHKALGACVEVCSPFAELLREDEMDNLQAVLVFAARLRDEFGINALDNGVELYFQNRARFLEMHDDADCLCDLDAARLKPRERCFDTDAAMDVLPGDGDLCALIDGMPAKLALQVVRRYDRLRISVAKPEVPPTPVVRCAGCGMVRSPEEKEWPYCGKRVVGCGPYCGKTDACKPRHNHA